MIGFSNSPLEAYWMENEPLKGKVYHIPEKGLSIFWYSSIKSAVQGLLKDIEKLESEITDEYKNEWLNTPMKHYCISLLNECKGLVKKWFPDVFKEEKDEP